MCEVKHHDIAEYDPDKCWTAGELRQMGYVIPDDVPDCGWVPWRSIKIESNSTQAKPSEDYSWSLSLKISFTEPFRWNEVSVTTEKKEP